MAVEITDVSLVYSGKQISETNKIPVGESFVITVEIRDVIAFIPLGSTGLITSDGKRFVCRKDDTDG